MPRCLCAVALWLPLAALAETPVVLPPLEVTAPRLRSVGEAPLASVSRVTREDLPGDPGLALDEALVRVPGVYAQNRYNLNQGLRLSIRGFGSRASFGVRGIRVLLDEVPLTMPDGQTELDALDLALLSQAELLRGPASALYGNGAGGVLSLATRDRPEAGHGRVDVAAGDLGERRLRGEWGGAGERWNGLGSFALRRLDGHRENLAAESRIGAASLGTAVGAGRLQLRLQTLDITADDPGALTRDEARTTPGAANPAARRFAASETIGQQRLALSWDAPLAVGGSLQARGWAGRRDFANRLPFAVGGQSTFDRRFAGVGGQWEHRYRWGALEHRLALGLDVEVQTDDRRRFDNAEGGLRGALRLAQDERARGLGVFLVDQVHWGNWRLGAGLRHDAVRLSVEDRFLDDGDDSGRRDFRKTSLQLGLGYALSERQLLFARYGSGFETPTSNELANPQDGGTAGGFNPDLAPATARNLELGWRHEGGALQFEATLYRIRNRGELLRFELPEQPGRSYFRNAGVSDRDGLELALSWPARPGLDLHLAYSLNDHRFRTPPGAGGEGGQALPGIPRQQAFAELAWRPAPAWVSRWQAVALDRVYADDANRERVPGYVQFNARLAWETSLAAGRFSPYLAVNNLTDVAYTDNLRVNAAAARYYEPAAGRVWVGGFSLTF